MRAGVSTTILPVPAAEQRPHAPAGAGRALGQKVPRAVRERQMLEAAAQMFAERGYQAVSMEEVAQAAGVTKPMVYAYFESKEGLFLAVVDAAAASLAVTVEEATPPELPHEARLWRGLLAVFTFIEDARESWAILYPQGPLSGGQFAAGGERANDRMAKLLTQLLYDASVAEGIDPEVARENMAPLAHSLVGAVEGLAAWWLRHPEEPKEAVVLRLMNFSWMGLGNLVRGDLWLPPPDA